MPDAPRPESPRKRAPKAKAAPPEPINAVVITRVVGEGGNIQVDVTAVGDVLATEMVTIIEMGRNVIREKLNLPA